MESPVSRYCVCTHVYGLSSILALHFALIQLVVFAKIEAKNRPHTHHQANVHPSLTHTALYEKSGGSGTPIIILVILECTKCYVILVSQKNYATIMILFSLGFWAEMKRVEGTNWIINPSRPIHDRWRRWHDSKKATNSFKIKTAYKNVCFLFWEERKEHAHFCISMLQINFKASCGNELQSKLVHYVGSVHSLVSPKSQWKCG